MVEKRYSDRHARCSAATGCLKRPIAPGGGFPGLSLLRGMPRRSPGSVFSAAPVLWGGDLPTRFPGNSPFPASGERHLENIWDSPHPPDVPEWECKKSPQPAGKSEQWLTFHRADREILRKVRRDKTEYLWQKILKDTLLGYFVPGRVDRGAIWQATWRIVVVLIGEQTDGTRHRSGE
ncbi:hypothetical protein [Laspinema olomoucense]|uniref:hypothetical protein n=1 Tax=Laspinema olomoucense TaxID=3231600 RepID=UPI0021BB23E6|nr:hypothetical protein [Laspinema sp. D3d]MCT7974062.1 hypothetical protein [Laspinema sp. D3d]